jgi:hypothetical protein
MFRALIDLMAAIEPTGLMSFIRKSRRVKRERGLSDRGWRKEDDLAYELIASLFF